MLNYIAEAAQVGPIGDWLGALPLRSRKTEKDSLQAITESLLEQLSPAGIRSSSNGRFTVGSQWSECPLGQTINRASVNTVRASPRCSGGALRTASEIVSGRDGFNVVRVNK